MTENLTAKRSKIKASRAWEERNPERTKYLAARRQASSFIRNYATKEDLEELENLIQKKREEL